MADETCFNAEKHKAFAKLVGEFSFGVTHKSFYCDNFEYSFTAHEYIHLMIGYIGGAEKFSLRTSSGKSRIVTREELERIFLAAYSGVLFDRNIEFADKVKEWNECKTVEDLNEFDHKAGWSYRSDALKAYEERAKKLSNG